MSEKLEYHYDTAPVEPCVGQIKREGVVVGAGINKVDTGTAVIWDYPDLDAGCYVFCVIEAFGTANQRRVSTVCDFEIGGPPPGPEVEAFDPSCSLREAWANRRV